MWRGECQFDDHLLASYVRPPARPSIHSKPFPHPGGRETDRSLTYRLQLPFPHSHPPRLHPFSPPHIQHDGEARAGACFPTPDAQSLVDGVEQAEILIEAVAVAGAQVEDVEGGIEQEGEFEMGGGLGGVWGEEGDVEGVVLGGGEVSGEDGRRLGESGTCLPMTPMQAMEGVIEVDDIVGKGLDGMELTR